MSYSVHQAPREDLERVLAPIWQRNLQIIARPHERFHWAHELNPCGPPETFLLQHGAEDSRSLVGSTTVFRRPMVIFGQQVVAGNLGDVAVDRSHRSLFPALSLQRAARDFARANLALLYAFPNTAARPLYERLKFQKLGQMVRYARPLLLQGNVPGELPLARALRHIAGWGDRATELWSKTRDRLAPHDWRLHWLDQPDARFDDLWQRGRHGVTVLGRRDSAYLSWRFCHKPGESFDFAVLERQGQLEAYAVVQVERDVAQLRDLFASDDLQLHRLLHALMPALRKRRMRTVAVRFLGAPWLVELLARHGFRPRENDWVVVVEPSADPPVAREVLLDPNNWYLTDFDEDT